MKNILFNALAAAALLFMPKVVFGQAPNLGTAANFVLFTTVGAVTNSGIPYLTHLTGNVGSNSGSSTGFGNVDGRMLDGGIESAAAATDLGIAYLELDNAIPTFFPSSLLGGGATLVPGVYSIPSAATMNGVLNLDAGGDPNAVFIFQIEGAFATASGTKVKLLNGALACNVFWKVEGMVSLGSGTTMRGTIVAHNDAISIGVGDTLEGRALSINGAITTNAILAYTPIGCGSTVLTGPAAPPLGAAAIFGVFAGIGSVTATPITYVFGDVGSNSAGATGFDPLNVTGTIHPAPDAATGAAAADLIIAYNYLNALTTEINLLYPALFGHDLVLTPHVYNLAGAPTTLTGNVILNAQGNPNAVFVIKMSGAFITSTLSRIILINGAKASNVYWKIDGATHIYDNSFFNGTIVGAGAITLNTGDTLNGRALTINGAVAINGSYIQPVPAPCQASEITGTMQVCVGGTTLLSNIDTGGMWYSNDTDVATVDTTSGLVTGIAAGTVIISFRSGLHCEATDTLLVNASPDPIVGSDTVCTGDTVMLSNLTSGGVWSSSDTAIASIDSTSGIVTGVASGMATISYTLSGDCSAVMTINVSPTPFAGTITGIAALCPTDTATVYSDTTGGIWSSANTAVASIDSVTGLVTALTAGTALISYTVTNSCGVAAATTVVTVSPLPNAGTISGTFTVCPAATTTLSSTATGGVWSSANIAVATVGTSGIVSGIASGTSTISYTVTTSCGIASATVAVTVSTLTSAGTLSGVASVCPAATTTLSSTVAGGVWTSTNLIVATIGSSSGVVTGLVLGTSTISYTVTGSCGTASATIIVTVNTVPITGTITGTATVCVGATTTLTNTVTGGVWSSVTTGVATVGSSSGIVSGVAAGTSIISYTVTNSCGTAATTRVVTVSPLPIAGTISGTALVCAGNTTTLSSTATGGAWSSANTAVATVGTAGVVSGIAAGTAIISYAVTNSCGTASASVVVTVSPLPVAGTITGTATVCVGATTTLANTATGGVWSSVTTGVATVGSLSGIVSGVAAGTSTISYTVTNSCGTAATTRVVTVSPLPIAGTISGTALVCAGSTTTLSSTATGGAWSSANTAVATVGTSGVVSGIAAGTAIISYAVTNSCGTASASVVVTVSPLPVAGTISGVLVVCASATTTLSNTATGGVWSSSNISVATVGSSSGIASGVGAGTATITYSVTNSCGTAVATATLTVNPAASAGVITGLASVCPGATSTLSSTVAGGEWISSNITVATIGSASGVVTGILLGTSTISYTVSNSCGAATATVVVTVGLVPNAGVITGTAVTCPSATTTLSNVVSGGVWSSDNSSVATIGATSGIVSGVAVGTSLISYTVTNSCGSASVTTVVTVNPLPDAGTVSGIATICVTGSTVFSSSVSGGEWSSAIPSIATVGSASGIVTGVAAGNASIIYTVTNSCGAAVATRVVTVNPLPNAGAITGIATICPAATTTLSSTVSGGVWSSTTTSVATVGAATGIVSGVSAGTSLISYSVANGCGTDVATVVVTVSPLPDAGVTSGTALVCAGATTTLTNTVSGGTWSSTDVAVATVGSASGILSGVSAGTSVISYTVFNSCGTAAATVVVTVSALPDAGTLSGIAIICATSTTVFSSSVAGGEWSSANPAVASVGSASGIVSGLSEGTSTIIYSVTNSCGTDMALRIVTVNPLPDAGTITGATSVCVSSNIALSNTAMGGVWSSSNTNATVSVTGVVSGVSAGTSVITYSVGNSCGTVFDTHLVVVNPLPNAGVISGPSVVCVGGVIILTNTATGGTWSSSNSTATVTGGMVIGVMPGIDTIIYSVSNVCGSASAIKIITVNVLPAMPVITTQSPSALCVGTMYQNFGTSTPAATGTEYNWSAVNATVWAQGAFSNYSLVNFNIADTAFVTLTATISATGCSSAAITAVNVGVSPAHTDLVSYFNMHFVCTPADNSTYQWGYDDAYTLDSVILKGEINQDYVNASPDLSSKYYWVMTTRNGCMQKTYYRAPLTVQEANETVASVAIFPNPASSMVNVVISNVAIGDVVVELSNILGQKVLSTTAIANKATLDVATLPAGSYLITCYHNGIRIAASRITKN